MKRILSLVLTFAMVFTTFGPSVYATGEGLADIITDEATAVEQVEETVVEETVTEEAAKSNSAYSVYVTVEGRTQRYDGINSLDVYYGVPFTIGLNDPEGNPVSTDIIDFDHHPELSVTTYDTYYVVDTTGVEMEGETSFDFYIYDEPVNVLVNVKQPMVYYAIDGGQHVEWDGNAVRVAANQTIDVFVKNNIAHFFPISDLTLSKTYGVSYTLSEDKTMFNIDMSQADYGVNEFNFNAAGSDFVFTCRLSDEVVTPDTSDVKIYIDTDVEEEYNPADGGFGTSQDSSFSIIFRDSNGNNISTSNAVMSEEAKIVLMEDDIRPIDNGDHYTIQISENTPEGTYTAYFTVNGVHTEVRFTVREFVFEEYNFPEDIETNVPKNGTLTVPVEKSTDRALTFEVIIGYMSDSFVPFDNQIGVSVDVANGTCTFNGAEIAKDPHALEHGGFYAYVYSYENGLEVAYTNKYFSLVDSSDDRINENSEVYFKGDYIHLPASGKQTYDVGFSLNGSEYNDIVLGTMDYVFVPFSEQVGIRKVYNDRNHITQIELDVDAITEAYPEIADAGWFSAGCYIVNGSNRKLSSVAGVHFDDFCDGTCGSPYAWFDVEDGIIRLPESGTATIDVLNRNLPEGLSIGLKLGYMDYDIDQFVPFGAIAGVEKNYNATTGLLESVTFDVEALAEAYPEFYEEGRIMACLTSVGENGNEGTFVCTDVYFAHFDGGSSDTPRFWIQWDWDFEKYGSFFVAKDQGEYTYNIIENKEYKGENNTYAEVLIGYYDEDLGKAVPYETQVGIYQYDLDESGVPDYVVFKGPEIAEAYPELAEQGQFFVAIYEHFKDSDEVSTLGCDVEFGDAYEYKWLYWDLRDNDGSNNFDVNEDSTFYVNLRERYYREGGTAKIVIGEVIDGQYVPNEKQTGFEVYSEDGIPRNVKFDVAALIEAYPEYAEDGCFNFNIVNYIDGEEVGLAGSISLNLVTQDSFRYEYNAEYGDLYILSGPQVITAEKLKEEFGRIANQVEFIVIYGNLDDGFSNIKRIEGEKVFSMFPNLKQINVFGMEYVDDNALSAMPNLRYTYLSTIKEMGDGVLSNCANLSSVSMSDVQSMGVNTFKGCPKLETAGTRGYGFFDIEFRNWWEQVDGRYINTLPANMLTGSSVKELTVRSYSHLGKDAFKGLNLDKLIIDGQLEVIDNAFTNTTIKDVYYLDTIDWFEENVTVNGSFAYQRFIDEYLYIIDSGNAGTYYDYWDYGDNVTYTYWSDGELVFNGEGEIGKSSYYEAEQYEDHSYYYSDTPWNYWGETANRIVIEHGITGIGEAAFMAMHPYEIIIPDTVTTIGDKAFAGSNFCNMVMPQSVTSAGEGVFEGCEYAENIWFGGIAPQWGDLFGTNNEVSGAVIPNTTVSVYLPDNAIEEGMKLKMEGSETIATSFENVPVGSSFHIVPTNGVGVARMWVNGFLAHSDFFTPYGEPELEIEPGDAPPIDSGRIGTINWTFNGEKLVLSGTGAIPSFNSSLGNCPWHRYMNDIRTVVIEEGITAIGDSSFGYMNLDKLEMPSTLKTIGNYNFECLEVKELIFPKNLTNIGSFSFNEIKTDRIVFNNKLTTIGRDSFRNMYVYTFGEVVGDEFVRNYIDITIPASVTSIGEGVFTDMGYESGYWNESDELIGIFTSTLRSIKVDEANPAYKVVNGALLTKDGKTLLVLPAQAQAHYGQYIPEEDYYLYDEFDGIYTVPDGVETIGKRAFYNQQLLYGVNLPNTAKTIKEYAFSNIGWLTHIVLPDNLTTIEDGAFECCWRLNAVQLGKNIKTINKNAFYDCESLERIDIRKDNPYLASEDGFVTSKDGKILYMVTSDAYRWNYMEELYVRVPYGVTTITAGAFEDMYQIRGIELPGSVTTIQKNAFKGTDNLTKIIIPASVKSVDPTAFVWSGIQEGMWGITGNNETVIVEEGTVYYGGTDAQWKAIAAKVNPQNVVTNCMPEGKLRVNSEEYTAEERKAFVLYEGETITETFEMYVEMFGNPITGEESTHDHPMLTWKMNEYGEAFNAECDNDYVTVTIKEPGTYEFMAYNGNNPKNDQVKFTYVVKDMADAVELTVSNGAYTRKGELVAARGTTVTPKLNWIDGLAWDVAGDFNFNGDSQYFTFNETNGSIKIAKDAPGGLYILTYTAERYDEEGNWLGYIDDMLEILVVEELVAGVELLNGNQGYMYGAPIGNKIVLDKAQDITSFTIEALATNGDADYQDFAFTSTVNENFTVVDNGDNTATVTLIGDTGNVTVTATAMDGSKKSAKVTFTAGIAMEELHITHTLPVVEAETIPADMSLTGREMHAEVVILAKGKTATLTAEMLPSAPTNKGVTWIAETIRNDEDNETDVVEIKNGKITTKAEGVAKVIAVAQDGTPCADIVYVRVVCPAEAVELVSDIDPIRGKVDAVDGVKAGKGTITIGEEVGSVTLVAEPVADGHVYEGVQWSISGGIAKYVTYDITGPVYDAQGELVELPKATFYADRPGDFTVKAVADDGTKVAATYKITVAQVPYAMEVTKLSGSKGEYTTGGLKAFILKGDFTKPTTVLKATPTVLFNNGDKTDVVKAPFNSYSVYVNDQLVENGKLEFTAPGLYTVKLVASHRTTTETTFIVDVRDNTAVELESLELSMPKGMAAGQAVAGKTYKISALLNGQAKIDTSRINVEWNVIVLNGSADNVSINNGTLDLKNAKGGESYLVQLKLTDKKDAENVIMAGLSINVKAPLVKNNLWLGLEETVGDEKVYTNITTLGDRLNAVTGTLETIKVLDLDGTDISSYQFDVKSSNPKVLDVEKVKNDTFNITAKDDGKVNLTISALDGSGYKQTIAVTVKAVPSPVNRITVAGATSAAYTVGMEQSIVVPYGLESKVSTVKVPVTPVSFTEMEWTSSDDRVATVDNLGADVNNVTSVTAKNGNVTYTTNGQVVITTGSLAGKATITGKALDGSGKTVKINVTVAASGVTNEIHLSAPANAANGGQTDGTVVLTWGKNMKLTATVLPNKAKNKVINYTIEGVAAKDSDVVTKTAAELEALGVTVNKTGTVAAKAVSKALPNPYVGWVKVTATLNYGFAAEQGGVWTTEAIEDTQYIFIDRPVQSIKFTTTNAQDKVVNAPANETIKKAQIEDGPISFKLTDKYTLDFVNKGYSEKVDGVMTDLTEVQSVYGTYDNLLWTTSNADLATVSDDGTITVNQFTKAGSVKITAKAQDGSNVKYTYTIRITK